MQPKELLVCARHRMAEVHSENRARAAQVIIQKNNLQQMAHDRERKLLLLEEKIFAAEREGKAEQAAQFRKEKAGCQASLEATAESVRKAIELSEVVRNHIQREQEAIRKKFAELSALQTEGNLIAITPDIERQLRRHVHQIFGVGYTLYPLRIARDIIAALLAIIVEIPILFFIMLR